MESDFDTLIVGAGPAGLLAATYLPRFRRRTLLVHNNASRAALIPLSHNYPGYADGIAGPAILAELRAQAARYDAEFVEHTVTALARDRDRFVTEIQGRTVRARTVLLATGVVDIEPSLPNLPDAIRRGLIRHCPICDAFEVTDRRIAIIGRGAHAVKEAHFLRHYTSHITLLLADAHELKDADFVKLRHAKIDLILDPIAEIFTEGKRLCGLRLDTGKELAFDSIYSALGAVNRSELAAMLGARMGKDKEIIVDAHQRTSVPGLYAAGDVVQSLNQIAVAFAQAAIASTAIHNSLRDS